MEKQINLICEFCDNWFLAKKVNALEKSLVQDLKAKGYEVKLTIEPSNSPAKPYYLYLVLGNKKKIILSNNATMHRKEGAIIDYSLNDANRKKVAEKIIESLKNK